MSGQFSRRWGVGAEQVSQGDLVALDDALEQFGRWHGNRQSGTLEQRDASVVVGQADDVIVVAGQA